MKKTGIFQNEKAMHALCIGALCSVSYLAVYFARNMLSAVTPEMIEKGFLEEYIGKASSLYFIFYAIGQLINGAIGDKIKARYMISGGLLFAGITNLVFARIVAEHPTAALAAYSMTGFFLAMIYGPMTKVVSENTDPLYTPRCSLGYTFASLFGSPLAGLAASRFAWGTVFDIGCITMTIMATFCFVGFFIMEKKGIVVYGRFDKVKKQGVAGIKALFERQIVKFTFVSIFTGVIRTSVVFWMPTYFNQHLGFSPEQSAILFTVATLVISVAAFLAVFLYERMNRNVNNAMLVTFLASAVFFVLLYVVENPWVNVALMTLAILCCNSSASLLWAVYCPSLYDTGMVSTATGFLDFVSYMSAAIASALFATAATTIGWGNLILVWMGIALLSVITCLPYRKWFKRAK